jgi:hypothetical protein
MPLGSSKMAKKNSEGFLSFLVLKILQTKYSLHWQSSEFLLTKDREIADNVHQGPLSIDFDDEWIRA